MKDLAAATLVMPGNRLTMAVTAPTTPGTYYLIDGWGGAPVNNSVILVEDERIKAVGTAETLPVPAGAEVVSLAGMSVLPGLWDNHVHTMLLGHSDYTHWDKTYPARFEKEIMPAAARQLLFAGVTSARDLGAPLDASINVRQRIARGEIPGPTLYVSGPFIQHEAYPGTEDFRWGVKGADDARAKVKRLADAGATVFGLDLPARGVQASNCRGCFDVPIAEWNMAMLVNLARDFRQMIRNQEAAVWDRSAIFQREIRGLTLGLWGYGGIGRETAKLFALAGAKVVVGADGRMSQFAGHVAAQKTVVREKSTFAYYGYFSGIDKPELAIHIGYRRAGWPGPTRKNSAASIRPIARKWSA